MPSSISITSRHGRQARGRSAPAPYHHIAFNVETDDALVAQKALYEELGYTDASEIKDRYYFHSMYVRSPGGILVECTAIGARRLLSG